MTTPMLSFTEENYLKAIYTLSERNDLFDTSTNQIAEHINTKPPTVTDMLKKLMGKKLVSYEKYKRVELTKAGKLVAIQVIRKHRLWEVFLHEKLAFAWDEVHEVAEQLEHIHSEKLIDSLERYLGFPTVDPHGDPIPSANGEMNQSDRMILTDMQKDKSCRVVGVKDSSTSFLHYLEKMKVNIGTKIKVVDKIIFDDSLIIKIDKGQEVTVSIKFADNLYVTC